MKPVIGVTLSTNETCLQYQLSEKYFQAISDCGGLPIAIGYENTQDIAQLLCLTNGIVLSGGGDLSPLLLEG